METNNRTCVPYQVAPKTALMAEQQVAQLSDRAH